MKKTSSISLILISLYLLNSPLECAHAGPFDFHESVRTASEKHPRRETTYTYGTTGFRMKAEMIDSVMFRVGILATLRSKKFNGQAIGVMITASHNPWMDNGAKIIDPMGEMIEESWESYATLLANSASTYELLQSVDTIISKENIDLGRPGNVVVARDTRPSGETFTKSVSDGVNALPEAAITDYGVLSTPQLHYITRCLNTLSNPSLYYGLPSENGYYQKFADSFKEWMKDTKHPLSKLYIDSANGVGAIQAKRFFEILQDRNEGKNLVNVEIFNSDTLDYLKLNLNCGADYVKFHEKPSSGVPNTEPLSRFAVFDGDADRLIYFYFDKNQKFHLIDGDKIAILAAEYLIELIQKAELTLDQNPIRLGVVQTAYANGRSTSYLREQLKIPVSCVPTGTRFLHHEAAKSYDVGVYFEANGHGTVLFSEPVIQAVRQTRINLESKPGPSVQKQAIHELSVLVDLVNQAVGDALSDLLLVEGILAHKYKGDNEVNVLVKWDNLYSELPCCQEKVVVPDRSIFKTTNAGQKLIEPAGFQEKIDLEVNHYKNSRCFVRPSGTEDVVRVYAEAETEANAAELATAVVKSIRELPHRVQGLLSCE